MSASTPSDPAGSETTAPDPTPAQATAAPAAAATAPAPAATSSGAAATEAEYAIVEAAGQQVWVQPNRYLDLNRLDAAVDCTITLKSVLLVKDAKGVSLGQPHVPGASVELTVMAHRRGPKILVYKMRRKKKNTPQDGSPPGADPRPGEGHPRRLTRGLTLRSPFRFFPPTPSSWPTRKAPVPPATAAIPTPSASA